MYLRILVSAWPTPPSVLPTTLVVDSAKVTAREELKRELVMAAFILLPAPPQNWKSLNVPLMETFICASTGQFGRLENKAVPGKQSCRVRVGV